MQYMITKDECQKQCDGKVCTTCGNPIIPFETVDNSRNPTHWPGCERCSKFNYGVPPEVYIKAAEIKKDYYNISVDDLCYIVRRLYSDAETVEREKDSADERARILNFQKEKLEAALAAAQGDNGKLREVIETMILFIPDGWQMPLGWNQVVAQAQEALGGKP
jgi:hypothetical protein